MFKYAIAWLCAVALLVSAGTARASFHLWRLNEVYSNADGSVQFIELHTGVGGQQFLAGQTITSSQGEPPPPPPYYRPQTAGIGKTITRLPDASPHSFTFPSNLPGDTAGKTLLIGTTGFAALGLVTPDYIVPNGFLFTFNGSVNFAGVDAMSWAVLPVDGTLSLDRNGATAVNSPQNFAGATASVPALPLPTCTLTASPSTITGGQSSTLTAICSPAATSYAWSANAGFPTTNSSGTVSPTDTTTYSVIGSNAFGAGNSASATVSVTPNCTLTASPGTITGGGSSTLTATCSPAAASYAWTNTGFAAAAASGSVSPAVSTTYSVIGSNAAGSGNSASATVSVTPNCTLTASPSSITAGQSSTLTATCSPAATSYAWTNTGFGTSVSSGTVSPTLTAIYSVIGSNAAGAGNSASATVSVTACTYSLSSTSQSVPLGITNGTLNVTSPPTCAWTASSNVEWITITSGSSGSGNGTVSYAVAANTNGSPRTGTLTVAGQTFTVTQEGIAVPTCTLAASASTINLGGSVTLTATCSPAATAYAWAPAAGLVPGPGNTATVTPAAVGDYQYSVTGSNAGGTGNTANTLVTVVPATFTSQSDCLFNWAETTYPSIFAPAGAISVDTLPPYYYRYYLQTNAYLGISSADSHVYYLGPLSNNSILDVGPLSGWLSTAGCQP